MITNDRQSVVIYHTENHLLIIWMVSKSYYYPKHEITKLLFIEHQSIIVQFLLLFRLSFQDF